jgi:hypothetical protein
MKVAVIGSRGFNDYSYLKSKLDQFEIDEIVSGGAKGADSLAERYAREMGIDLKVYLPKYKKFGRVAPLIRNRQIVEDSDLVVAFWDGKSKGTKNAIGEANKLGKKIQVF